MKRQQPLRAGYGIVCTFMLLVAPGLRAEEGDPFQIGGSCAALAYTTGAQLSDLLTATSADDLGSFCVPEQPFECADYSSHLKGRGHLLTGEDGYHCTLQDRP